MAPICILRLNGERAVLRRGEPGNAEADRALPMQLHRVGPVREVRLHRCISTGYRQSLEGPNGQRFPALLLPGKGFRRV